MKASELITKLQAEIQANGDKELIIAANRHSYMDTKINTREDKIILSLFDKVAD